MPTYEFTCPHESHNGHKIVFHVPVSSYYTIQACPVHGLPLTRIYTPPVLVKVAADVCYDSPIDGRPITSHDAWKEDLKRNDCVAYDPEMKRDAKRRIDEGDAKLDALIDAHVEETIEKMPTAKRAQLYSELTEQGMTADVVRSTPTA